MRADRDVTGTGRSRHMFHDDEYANAAPRIMAAMDSRLTWPARPPATSSAHRPPLLTKKPR
ncbi:MAG: hypothetical protein Q4G26_02810 [Paracoccus sp. (in: a-proteobacteria)]|nr:hypothetical protein [Paracoccus sp. (in: a-proteobacteria)]